MKVRLAAVLLVAGAVAGCSRPPARPVHVAAKPTPCPTERHLRAGVSVPGRRMGAIQFLSPSVGVGITAGWFACPGGPWTGVNARLWLAVSRDGGHSWQVRGRAVPTPIAPQQTGLVQHLVAASTAHVWAVTADGRVFSTPDGGASWTTVSLPRPVVGVTYAGGYLWALSCPQQSDSMCHPVLERSRPGGAWVALHLPSPATMLYPSLAVSRLDAIVYGQRYPTGSGLLVVSRGGGRFAIRPAPRWRGQQCTIGAWLVSAGRRTWVLCLGGAAAGSSTKALLASDDEGLTWRTMSAVTDLTRSTPDWTISRMEPSALAAGSPNRLWAAWQNGFSESEDGGSRWRYLPNINPQGLPCAFAVLSSTHAWLLAAGTALWRTTDGVHWRLVDAFDPSELTRSSG